MNKFAHVYPAMVTPMHEDGSFNLEAAKKHADWMISEGIDGLGILMAAGEYQSMSLEEHKAYIREMVPFNLLRNSRADDGLAYWVSSGFEADSENGASGTASFKAEGVAGMTKSLSQTVYPANRSSYTLSAQIGSENLEKLSDDAQVGIEVVIEYEDGSTERRFIDLY